MAVDYWTSSEGEADGQWTDPAHWSLDVAPDKTTDAVINYLGYPFQVMLASSIAVNSLSIDAGVTLDFDLTDNQQKTLAVTSSLDNEGTIVVNQGTALGFISGTFHNGGDLIINGQTNVPFYLRGAIDNAGSVVENHGALVFNDSVNIDDKGTLSGGGTYTANDGRIALIQHYSTADSHVISHLEDVTISLIGAGSQVSSYNQSGEFVDLADTLTTIGKHASLQVLGDRDWTTDLDLTVKGKLGLGGGTISTNELDIVKGGSLSGYGTLATEVVIENGARALVQAGETISIGAYTQNDGLIMGAGTVEVLNGGTLEMDWHLKVPTVRLDGGGQLILAKGLGAATNVEFSDDGGFLYIGHSQHFKATITGFSGHDSVDLGDLQNKTVKLSWVEDADKQGGVLTVDDGQRAARLHFEGDYSAKSFHHSDSGGGVSITMRGASGSTAGVSSGTPAFAADGGHIDPSHDGLAALGSAHLPFHIAGMHGFIV